MTKIPKNFYSEDMPKHVSFRPAKCRDCGASNLNDASNKCHPQSTPNGEYYCDGSEGDCFTNTSWDVRGRACRPTNKELKKEARAFIEYYYATCPMGCGRIRANCQCSLATWDKYLRSQHPERYTAETFDASETGL